MNDFEEYFKAGEPGRRERAEAWATAIGWSEKLSEKVVRKRLEKAVRKGGHWEVVE